jgi:hypothetical protein
VSHPLPEAKLSGTAVLVPALAALLLGCETSHLYFHQDKDGARYYETKTGEVLRVTTKGAVYRGTQRIGKAALLGTYNETAGVVVRDWDLKTYEVVPPSGYCTSMFEEEIRPVSCWTEVMEVPMAAVTTPALWVYRLFVPGGQAESGETRPEQPERDQMAQ